MKKSVILSLLSTVAMSSFITAEQSKQNCVPCEPCIPCTDVQESGRRAREGFVRVPKRCAPDGSKIPSAKIFYKLQGKGDDNTPTLVFLHGLGFSHVIWSCAQAELSSCFKTLAIDMRGFGCSELSNPAKVAYTCELFTRDLHAVLQKLCIKNPIIVGHSLGGCVTLMYTKLFPEELKGIVLVGSDPLFVVPDSYVVPGCDTGCPTTVLPTSPTCWPYPFATSTQVAGIIEAFNTQGYENVVRNVFTKLFYNEACQEELVNAQNSLIQTFLQEGEALTVNIINNLLLEDLRPLLPNIKVPALVVAGTIDAVIPPQASSFMASQIPGAVLVNFDAKGHMPQVTDFKRFNCLLKDFALGDLAKCCVCPLVKPECHPCPKGSDKAKSK